MSGLDLIVLLAVVPLGMLLARLLLRRDPNIGRAGIFLVLVAFLALCILVIWLLSYLPAQIFYVGVPVLALISGYVFWRRGDKQKLYREVSGKCVHCGYDLRATEMRCPECGHDVTEEILRRRRIAAELRAARATHAPPSQTDVVDAERKLGS